MAICNEQLHPHMAEYIEFKSWQVNVGRAEMPSDTSADEIVSAWREADANRRKSCDGRDWEYADSKRPLPSLPDGSFYQRRRQRKQRVTKNNQDSPEVRSSPLQRIFGVLLIPSITVGTSIGGR